MTPPSELNGLAIAPFLIDWDNGPHPAAQAPDGLVLDDFVIRMPDLDHIIPLLDALGLTIHIQRAQAAGFCAAIHSPAGQELVLTS